MPLVRVKRKHQVTIPVKVREALELGEGGLLNVEVEGNRNRAYTANRHGAR